MTKESDRFEELYNDVIFLEEQEGTIENLKEMLGIHYKTFEENVHLKEDYAVSESYNKENKEKIDKMEKEIKNQEAYNKILQEENIRLQNLCNVCVKLNRKEIEIEHLKKEIMVLREQTIEDDKIITALKTTSDSIIKKGIELIQRENTILKKENEALKIDNNSFRTLYTTLKINEQNLRKENEALKAKLQGEECYNPNEGYYRK